MPKPLGSRGWARTFRTLPVLFIVTVAAALLLVGSAKRHITATGFAATGFFARPLQPATVTPAARGHIQTNFGAFPLAFERNQGQTNAQVAYIARANGYILFLTANDAVFSIRPPSAPNKTSVLRRRMELRAGLQPLHSQSDSVGMVRMQLAGANLFPKISASEPLPGTINYFVGSDPSKWQTNVAHYARIAYQNIYPGVNLAFHGAQRQLEFDFIVAPGASPASIGLQFTGAKNVKTDDSGNLVVSSAAGDVLLHKPVAYQEQNGARQPVDARFMLKANQVRFNLGTYDHSRELVIDPSVSYLYSTYLGGSGNDAGYGIAFDGNNNAYVAGQTASANFPGASNTLTGTANAFVTCIAGDGQSLIYSVYVGGDGTSGDSGNAIAVDLAGHAYVAGGTTSSNFPHTTGVFQSTLKGTINAFVLELAPNGALTYSTYLGGTSADIALGIALASDLSGDVYVAGKTSSGDFPTVNPIQTSGGGFVTKLNSTGTALAFSTYLAVAGDSVNAVTVDSSDNAYVTGQTYSSSFPTTTGAFQTVCGSCTNGNANAFVTVLNPNGNGYVYSTFLGGNALDAGNGIAVDSSNNAYITGVTTSTNFPTTAGSLQTNYGGATDAFVTKLNPAGNGLVYSTYLGGSGFDIGAGIALDPNDNAYVTGETSSSNLPTANPTQSALGGGSDAFVSELNSTGSQLIFSTYLGGSADEDDGGFGAIATNGSFIYVTGDTQSTNFPTQSPYQAASGGGGNADAYVVKFSQSTSTSFTLSATTLSPATVSPGSSATSIVTVTPDNGFSGNVTLTCSVSGPTGAVHLPTCSAASATPGAPGTLTVSTTAATAVFLPPPNQRSTHLFPAMFLPIGGTALLSLGLVLKGSRYRKVQSFPLLVLLTGLVLMPACGGSSSSTGAGGGNPGTTAGTYTITVSGSASGGSEIGASPSLTLTVN